MNTGLEANSSFSLYKDVAFLLFSELPLNAVISSVLRI
jgi:hypothetical protein